MIQYCSLCLTDKVLGLSPTALCGNSPVETDPGKYTFLTPGLCFPQPLLKSLLLVTYWAPACPTGGLCEIVTILDSGISQILGHSLALQQEKCHSYKMGLSGHECDIVNMKDQKMVDVQ